MAAATTRKKTATKTEGEGAVLEAVAKMPDPWRGIGERLHAIITSSAPDLAPRTWYGMPAYSKDGKVVCFFRGGDKFKECYLTLGFNDSPTLDDGNMWPISYALTKLTKADEAKVGALVERAVR